MWSAVCAVEHPLVALWHEDGMCVLDQGRRFVWVWVGPQGVPLRPVPFSPLQGASSRLLRHRDVILKKVKRLEAEHAVMDVTLYRKSDKPSSLYKKIG